VTACATGNRIEQNISVCNLIIPVPDTDFRDFLEEVDRMAKFAPEIITAIEADMDNYAREKKSLRIADRKFLESRMSDLPGLQIMESNILARELSLAVGRPRMPGYAVFVFLMIRGFLGSLTTKPSRRFLRESMSLYAFLQDRGLGMPAMTTILENVNLVSHSTRDMILGRQIALIIGEELDDFNNLTVDSTAVKANSSWPTDSRILTALLSRADRLGQKLHLFGLNDFSRGGVRARLEEMRRLDFQICLVAGKANSKGKLKRHYRKLLRRGRKVADALKVQLNQLESTLVPEQHAPSRRALLTHLVNAVRTDIADAERVLEYAENRVFSDKCLPSKEKILSLSDGSAAYIEKGGRNPVIGYKPQLVRSANGFVSALIVPDGNAPDSRQLVPAIADSVRRTCVVPELVSADDGYASAAGRDALRDMGVGSISISGAKGKKLTSAEDWESEIYSNARRCRSAVESLMFTIKDGFEFGELGRRGLEAVRDELLEKILAYNTCRIILMRERRREQYDQSA
jgi:hypothetical protein